MSLKKLSEKMKAVSNVDNLETEPEGKTEKTEAANSRVVSRWPRSDDKKPTKPMEITGQWEPSEEPGAIAERKNQTKCGLRPKVIPVARAVIEMLTQEDMEDVLKAIRDGLKAEVPVVVDRKTGEIQMFPDHKVRTSVAFNIIAHKDGLPVQRQIVLTNGFLPLDEQMRAVVSSPEAQRELEKLGFEKKDVSKTSRKTPEGE